MSKLKKKAHQKLAEFSSKEAVESEPEESSEKEGESSATSPETEIETEEEEIDNSTPNQIKTLLEEDRDNNNKSGVEAALTRFICPDVLCAANAYECEKCCVSINKRSKDGVRKTVKSYKRYLIFTPPPILTLHLKRFEQRVRPNQTKVLYLLYGVVCHSGDLSGGHYVAYVRSRPEKSHVQDFFQQAVVESFSDASRLGDLLLHLKLKKELNLDSIPTPTEQQAQETVQSLTASSRWYYCSDSTVSQVSEEKVRSCEAYLLFYERVF